MALTLVDQTASTSTTLRDYAEHIRHNLDVRDRAAVLDSASMLGALARDPNVIVDYLNHELAACEDLNSFQKFSEYGATNFILDQGPGYAVRANLWLPPDGDALQQQTTHKLGVYQVPHDHDFSFLTVGYWGPGYSTSIYEYDPATCSGIVGSKVDMHFLEQTTLTQGKVMFYRASQDIHTQEYPQGPSISINLLLVPDKPGRQYLFDPEAGTITAVLANRAENSVGLCSLARYLGDDTTVERLDVLAVGHHDPRVRWAATESLCDLLPSAAPDVLRSAAQDRHEMVRQLGRARLSGGPSNRVTLSPASSGVRE